MLALIGYQSSTTGGAIQSVLVQERIYTMANLLPAFCLFVSAIILLVGYPLNRSKTVFIGEELKKSMKDREKRIADKKRDYQCFEL